MNSASDVGSDRLVIAAYLDLEADHWLAELRHRFGSLAQQVPAHVTLVHPFRVPEEWSVMSRHAASVAGLFRAFQLVCQGVTGHADEYLFLNVKRGNDELIALRDALPAAAEDRQAVAARLGVVATQSDDA